MSAVNRVAIAGAGVAGLGTAILLAEGGVNVDVYESKPELSALGSGITLQGNALRVFDRLGIWEAVQAKSYGFDKIALRTPGPAAQVIAEIPDDRTGGPEYPATVGMYRPDLAKILLERAQEVGVSVHFGSEVIGVSQNPTHVKISLTGGDTVTADLLVGADGLHSAVRGLIGIDTTPKHTGMGAWRAFVQRPRSVEFTELYYGGPCYIAGYCPTGEDTMYAYLVEKEQPRTGLSPEESVAIMAQLSLGYGGPWNDFREHLSTSSRVNYTWFTTHLVDGAWNRGRVVLIGEAAHSAPPTIAQGAAQAAEDAVVIAELLLTHDDLNDDLWREFHERRVARVAEVCAASVQLGEWLIEGNRDAPIPVLMHRIAELVSVPA